ncbi:SH3 domain-containing protein [Devosia sp.]|uniref:SH3 domain-containing protein n=1 Tax=Devosia sp. TaxID=1871048 RepID=UPI001ACE19D7|nr:SH3 domain-containing protein [Devosia sp.]MBN9309980.1 hypothetical protein [Devosia sp.]
MKPFFAVLCAVFLLVLPPIGAAAQGGTPAWSLRPLVLMEGPGKAYDVVGRIDAEVRIRVDRCSRDWCRVHRGHAAGWTSLHAITFGVGPHSPYAFPRLGYKWGGPGVVCLYEGPNFTGVSLCGKSGFKARDLLLLDADNRFSSVSIEGNVSVLLCRDRDFHDYCVRLNDSKARLPRLLDNGVSSMRVY